MDDEEFSLVIPFWIDTDAYSDRDREMFVCGVEFQMVYEAIRSGRGWHQAIHNENTSRIRMMCGKLNVPHLMEPYCDTWTNLWIPAASDGQSDETN